MDADRNYLTVHVLDTVTGRPAAGMDLVLRRVSDGALLAERTTNDDGRCDPPLIAGTDMAAGPYELAFSVSAWRTGQPEQGFYDVITIRFVLSASPGHVHIPLLLSPYGYSTYRGS